MEFPVNMLRRIHTKASLSREGVHHVPYHRVYLYDRSFSKALSGESVYKDQSPHAEPVSPSWKNIPMIAIMARRPLASSAFNFFLRTSGSEKPVDMMPTDLRPRKPAP